MDLFELLGTAEWWLRPSLRKTKWVGDWRPEAKHGGPFNAQQGRAVAVRQILHRMAVKAIVETGTHRGKTTKWFAENFYDVPVHSVEFQPRLHAYAKARLRSHKNVQLHLGQSQEVLPQLVADNAIATDRVFFYLDAHWDLNLPLEDELKFIFKNFSNSVILIDDFAVPGDSYMYLDMGPGICLDETALKPIPQDATVWYPSIPAYQETGYNSGWVVVGTGQQAQMLKDVAGLRAA